MKNEKRGDYMRKPEEKVTGTDKIRRSGLGAQRRVMVLAFMRLPCRTAGRNKFLFAGIRFVTIAASLRAIFFLFL
ncbi:MAG: hypothetical protein LBJ59_05455 [Zoogloeaceae bacterium]|jgi:hypothetical protein|nr:hypothetical protein [Zoogloeaceae bacterium]